MTAVAMVTIKTTLILAVGMAGTLALHQRSAALRHWILALTILSATAAPIVGLVSPSWTLPSAAVPATTTDPRVEFAINSQTAPPADAGMVVTRTTNAPSLLGRIAGAVTLLWMVGAALNLAVLLVGMSRLTRLRSGCVAGENAAIGDSLKCMSHVLGSTRRVTLLCSDRQAVPVTWGVVWPKVVLPTDAGEWPRERLDVVLAHELAHITRGDWLVQTTAEVCKAIYWFNPLFWIACARLRHESERACDDAVMSTGVTSHAYAEELVALARRVGRNRQPWLPAPAMAARPSNLERRVRAMMNVRIDRCPITRRGRWLSAVALVGVALPIATFAQGGYATFSGVVVDPQDRVLPATTITVSDARRNVKHETKTDRDGRFELVGLPAGDYAVEASLPGFRRLTDSLVVNGQSVNRMLKMQVGLLQETITVVSDDGAVTNARQSGNAVAKRPNPACQASAAVGAGGNIRPPHKVKDVRPGYPGVDGHVKLAATIGTDGTVTDVEVVSADRPELTPSAIDAVRQWEFDSTLLNCVPIEVQMNVDVMFRRGQ